MGKSSKKSTPKVDAAPAVTPASKSVKEGKREAEEAIDKAGNAKKLKKNEGLDQAVQKEKAEVKTHKKEKQESSSSSEDSSSDEEGKDTPEKVSAPKDVPASATKNNPESSDSSYDSESDESSDDEVMAKSATPAGPIVQLSKKSDESDGSECDGSESDGSDDDNDSSAAMTAVGSKGPTFIAQTGDSKRGTDVEMVGSVTPNATMKQPELKSEKKAPQTPATPEVQTTGGKTLFVANLPFDVERADVENFFKDDGEIVDVRLAVNADLKFKGYGHVEFATVEAVKNALKKDGQNLGGRSLRLDLAKEKGEKASYAPHNGKESNQRGEKSSARKIFVRGFDKSIGEDEIQNDLEEHFKSCGEISKISIPKDYGTGAIKGMAYLEFKDVDGFNNALELNGSQLGDEYLTVEEARSRGDNRDGWSGGRGGGRSGGRRGGRNGGGHFGGRSGGGRGGSRGR